MRRGMKSRWLAGVLCMILVLSALTGCQSSNKYEKIDLATVAQADTKAESRQTEETGAGEITDGVSPLSIEPEVGEAKTSSISREITTSNGFTDTDDTVYITNNKVNLRSQCEPNASVVAQLNEGQSLKRTGYSDGWTRVLYNDSTCYISSQYVTTQSSDAAAAAADGENAQAVAETTAENTTGNGRVVAIDAGHQAKGNNEKEPIGPGSSTMKAKVASGATGVATGMKEYELNLMVSKKLKRILEERGYQVIMIRETHDVNISNAERAEVANKSGASIFVRVHANSLDNSSVHGVLTMCQTAGNPYNGNLHDKSYSLSKKITDSIAATTGFKNRGVQETDTMSGINWCTIPVSIVEMGFLSNPEEDKNMSDDGYQEKIAQGIANGIDAYFGE